MYGIPFRLILAGVALLAAFIAGVKVSDWRFEARRAAEIDKATQALRVEQARVDAVAAAYESIRAGIAERDKRTRPEVIRETTTRVEYRCELPAAGERLRLDAVRAANAAAGFPAAAVPADPRASGQGLRGTADGLPGSGLSVR